MKIKLYIDFDGVILNTIDVSYDMLRNSNIDMNNYEEVRKFYYDLDWEGLINNSKPINNSINNLKKVIDSGLFDVSILTHINSDNEIRVKKNFLEKNFGDIDSIFVNKRYDKCDVVDPRDAILVDDFMDNLNKWKLKGGIPIKFSTTNKNYDCISIDSLDMLIDKYDEIRDKMLISIKKLLV